MLQVAQPHLLVRMHSVEQSLTCGGSQMHFSSRVVSLISDAAEWPLSVLGAVL